MATPLHGRELYSPLVRLHEGVLALPIPTPLDLADLPIIRAARKLEPLERRDGVDGPATLPLRAYRTEHEAIAFDGMRYRVIVTGDPVLGLPYGGDGDVWMALLAIVNREARRDPRWLTGEVLGASLRMLAAEMGREWDGGVARMLRGALLRLAHTRVHTSVIQNMDAEATAILRGVAHANPVLPDRVSGRAVVRQEQVRYLLDLEIRKENTRGVVEEWIQELKINPVWINQVVSGWVAWVDQQHYRGLASYVAKRLYVVCAGQAARNAPRPWYYDAEDLTVMCGVTSTSERPANIRERLLQAANELKASDILSQAQVERLAGGRYRFHLEPGPVLTIAGWLRGVGLLDLDEARTQLLLLRSFGFQPEHARELLATKPNQTRHMLSYALFISETDPGQVRRSWTKWIADGVRDDWTHSSNPAYQRWRTARLAGNQAPAAPVVIGHIPPAAAGDHPRASAPESTPPHGTSPSPDATADVGATAPSQVPPTDAPSAPRTAIPLAAWSSTHPDAPEMLWRAALEALPTGIGELKSACLRDAVPCAVRDGSLILEGLDQAIWAVTALEPHFHAWLTATTAGAVTRAVIRRPGSTGSSSVSRSGA